MHSNYQFHSTSYTSLRRVQQVLVCTIALCTIVLGVWVGTSPPTQDYEVIYAAYPSWFWALVSGGLAASMVVFVVSTVREDGYWKLALALVCVIYVLFHLLPLFRGWALYGRSSADVLAHIGYAKQIVQQQTVAGGNHYPGSHALFAAYEHLGIPYRRTPTLLSALLTPLYIVGIFLFARRFAGERVAVATLVCAVPLLFGNFHHAFLPATMSFFLFPMFLFLFVQYRSDRRLAFLVLTALTSVTIVVFHPVTSLYVVGALFVSLGTTVVYARLTGTSSTVRPEVVTVGIVALAWGLWYGTSAYVRDSILRVLGFAEADRGSVASAYGSERLGEVQSLSQVVVGFVDLYGPIFLVCGLASLAALVVGIRVYRGESRAQSVWLASQFVAGVGAAVVSIFGYVIAFDPIRNSQFMILTATLLAGLLVYWFVRASVVTGERRWQVATVALLAILVFSVPVAVTNSYDTRAHMTYSEEEGTDWLLDHKRPDALVASQDTDGTKAWMYHAGDFDRPENVVGYGAGSPMPKFFGYGSNETVGSAVDGTSLYFVTKEYDTEYFLVQRAYQREQLVVYDAASRQRLDGDPTVNKLYTNGNYTTWHVVATNSSR